MLWWRLSLREDFLAAFRETFGDERLIHIAASLVAGVNHVNRSMGLSDLYPFVLSDVQAGIRPQLAAAWGARAVNHVRFARCDLVKPQRLDHRCHLLAGLPLQGVQRLRQAGGAHAASEFGHGRHHPQAATIVVIERP